MWIPKESRSPRQLWNALLRCLKMVQSAKFRRSPRQLWNALLHKRCLCAFWRGTSQSPSIMECSPTLKPSHNGKWNSVAVPVNYGMLSYLNCWNALKQSVSQSPSIMECSPTVFNWLIVHTTYRRSPRQLWNALLHYQVQRMLQYWMSQSPSIMECSPTTQ